MTTLFIDMDDVVADFSKEALRITGYIMPDDNASKYPKEDWDKFLKFPRLYRDLEKCTYADNIVHTCLDVAKTNNWNVLFLTAVPRDNDFPWAFNDKIEWAKKYYPTIPVWFGPYSKDKHKHCTPGDVLVDDRQRNITEWISQGGIGILCKDPKIAIEQILKLKETK